MKILVNISVPAISEQYDVLLPDFVEIQELVPLLATAIESLSNRLYVSSKHEFLCLKEQNILLKQEETLQAYDIKNGDHLFLI